jgi:hypothetical protein
MAVDPNPRTSMPARTRAAVPRETEKHFDIFDDIGFLLLALNNAEMFSATATITDGIVTLTSVDDHRERLKLIWSFPEAAVMVGRRQHQAYVAAFFKLDVSIW